MNIQAPQEQTDSIKFVYLQANKQKVTQLISSYNRKSLFALIFSIILAIYQLQKNLSIYLRPYYQPEKIIRKRQIEYHSLNLHTFYALMTLFVALYMVYKTWRIRKQPNFTEYGLETFRREFTIIQDYIYLNLLLTLFSMVRFFQAGFLHIWLDFAASAIGIFLGKTLERQREGKPFIGARNFTLFNPAQIIKHGLKFGINTFQSQNFVCLMKFQQFKNLLSFFSKVYNLLFQKKTKIWKQKS